MSGIGTPRLDDLVEKLEKFTRNCLDVANMQYIYNAEKMDETTQATSFILICVGKAIVSELAEIKLELRKLNERKEGQS